jgi:transcriptional regulator with XRE-family HTH domain
VFAARIDQAMRAKGLTNMSVSAAFDDGKDPGGTRIANWRAGRNRPVPANLDKLATILGMTPGELLGYDEAARDTRDIGPARAAVALATAAAAEGHVLAPSRVNGVSGAPDVFGFTMRGDGSTVIRLHAVMPPGQHERAVALIQHLLAFGLVKTEG